MATLTPDGGDLVLSLSAWERLGGLHGDIRVPLSARRRGRRDRAAVQRAARNARAGHRLAAARIALGTWRGRSEKGFAAVYRGKPGVVVRLRDSEFAWLCVSADDPPAVVERIRAAL